MTYIASLYEIKIQHLDGVNFSMSDYYDDGTDVFPSSFMNLIGFKKLNQGLCVYQCEYPEALLTKAYIYFNPRTRNLFDYNKGDIFLFKTLYIPCTQ